MPTTFRELCQKIQQIRETRGSNAKISHFAGYLKTLDDEDLTLAVLFTGEGAFTNISGKRASVGSRTSGLAAAEFCKIDYDLVFKPCRTATGSSSETIERLMNNIPVAVQNREPRDLLLREISTQFEQLRKASSRADKQELLIQSWSMMTPVEIKYFIRMMGQGSLRIGFETRSIIAAISNAFGSNEEEVRYAHMITGSLGKTALLSKHNQLDEASFRLFHPLSFMLASPIESRTVENLDDYVGEEKFDGMRAQVHVQNSEVSIFSRDLNDITHTFPEINTFFQKKEFPGTVLDGEICVFRDDTIQPFQFLQKRMGLKKPGKKIIGEYPVIFIAYDLLYINSHPIFDKSLTDRRNMLEQLSEKYEVPMTQQFKIADFDHLDNLFEQALNHGNEGLMLKHKNSTYEYGQRKKSWLKVKKPGGSIDTVMMYAHAGSGKRGGSYSDFTLGVSVKEDERYEEEFIPIGKAYGGYTNEELKQINKKVKELTVEKYGPTLGLLPRLVIEVEFDDIQINKRTKAGFTLRLPRFKSIRWDLGPDDVDTLKDVENLYSNKINQKRQDQTENPSFIYYKNQ